MGASWGPLGVSWRPLERVLDRLLLSSATVSCKWLLRLSSAIVLGPQRREPIVREAIDHFVADRDQPVAVVTAGWEEREDEDGELREHVERPLENLKIWARVERIFAKDKQLHQAIRERHTQWKRAQDLYRLRLSGLMVASRELLRQSDRDTMAAAEEEDAWELVRGLDQQHMNIDIP